MHTGSTRHARTLRPATAALGGILITALLLAGCRDGDKSAAAAVAPAEGPSLTPAVGSKSTLLGRATFFHPFDITRVTGDWQTHVSATPALDVAVQSIDFPPGSSSGWHKHPGPVFIQVVSGVMTFYESDDPQCRPIVRRAGEGYLDVGEHAHIARNENPWHPAQNIVTYFAPPGATLRIDAPAPGNCPF